MIKLVLATEEGEKDIVQHVKVVAIPAFTKVGFTIVEEKHTVKEMKSWMKQNNIECPEKATAAALGKLL